MLRLQINRFYKFDVMMFQYKFELNPGNFLNISCHPVLTSIDCYDFLFWFPEIKINLQKSTLMCDLEKLLPNYILIQLI